MTGNGEGKNMIEAKIYAGLNDADTMTQRFDTQKYAAR